MRFCFVILTLVLLGCTKREQTSPEEVQSIYVPAGKKPKLSEFVSKMEYYVLPKEVSAGFFDNVTETEKYFIFSDYDMSMSIYVLDRDFNLISTIDSYGEGPGQYTWIIGVNFNEERQIVEILTHKNLIRYSPRGEYLESIKTPFVFGNLRSMSKNSYIVYNKYEREGASYADPSCYLAAWNSDTGTIEPLVYHEKNDIVLSFADMGNMFRHKEYVYASHIYLDTIYRIDKSKRISKIFIDLGGKNLPMDRLKNVDLEYFDSNSSKVVFGNYFFHNPKLMVSDNFFADEYIDYNDMINFFVQNRKTGHVVSGREVVNDIDFGVRAILPEFIDQSGNLYTFHQYEEAKQIARESKNPDSPFKHFVESLDPETSFVLIKYTLKNF